MFIEHLLYAKSWSRGWNQVERTDPGSKTGARDTSRLCSSCLSLDEKNREKGVLEGSGE